MITLTKSEPDILQCAADQDVSNWKIRVRITDNKNLIKKANQNVRYGSVNQISIDEEDPSIFYVHIFKNETDIFDKRAEFELELENPEGTMTAHIDKIVFVT